MPLLFDENVHVTYSPIIHDANFAFAAACKTHKTHYAVVVPYCLSFVETPACALKLQMAFQMPLID
jgi:hypothetical protein